MFWKIAITATVAFIVLSRTGLIHHPLVKLLIPRAWRAPLAAAGSMNREPRTESKFGQRVYVAMVALACTAVAAWVIARFTIAR